MFLRINYDDLRPHQDKWGSCSSDRAVGPGPWLCLSHFYIAFTRQRSPVAAGFPCQESPPALRIAISLLACFLLEKTLSCHCVPNHPQKGQFLLSSPTGCITEEVQPKIKVTVPPWLIPSSVTVDTRTTFEQLPLQL